MFGFSELGIIGAAVGTLVSRFVMVAYLWFLFMKNDKIKPYLVNFKWRTIERTMLKKVANLGLPSALQMFFEVGIFTSAVWLSGVLGTNPQAANQIGRASCRERVKISVLAAPIKL